MDGLSIGRFAAKADLYLSELGAALRDGCYRPQAVKRVDIPKGDGRTRPLGIPKMWLKTPVEERDGGGKRR